MWGQKYLYPYSIPTSIVIFQKTKIILILFKAVVQDGWPQLVNPGSQQRDESSLLPKKCSSLWRQNWYKNTSRCLKDRSFTGRML